MRKIIIDIIYVLLQILLRVTSSCHDGAQLRISPAIVNDKSFELRWPSLYTCSDARYNKTRLEKT